MEKINIKEKIKDIIVKNCCECGLNISVDELSSEKNLKDFGINSLIFIRIMVDIESEFGFEFSDEDLNVDSEKLSMVESFIEYIISKIE